MWAITYTHNTYDYSKISQYQPKKNVAVFTHSHTQSSTTTITAIVSCFNRKPKTDIKLQFLIMGVLSEMLCLWHFLSAFVAICSLMKHAVYSLNISVLILLFVAVVHSNEIEFSAEANILCVRECVWEMVNDDKNQNIPQKVKIIQFNKLDCVWCNPNSAPNNKKRSTNRNLLQGISRETNNCLCF